MRSVVPVSPPVRLHRFGPLPLQRRRGLSVLRRPAHVSSTPASLSIHSVPGRPALLFSESQRLTLPSSGRAFGTPLKSNVRPRFRLHHEGTTAVRCAARTSTRNTGCRRRFEVGASGRGRKPRSARAVRPSAASARLHHLARECADPACPSVRTLSIEEPNYKLASLPQGQESLVFLALSIHSFSSSLGRAACVSGVGMLRHPNTWRGCLSRSAA